MARNIPIDLTGQQFNSWTALSYAGKKRWVCRCECGVEKEVLTSHLKSGLNKSCRSCAHKSHGLRKHYLYSTWEGMKQRCLNENNRAYENYGGRGITIHEPWIEDFKSFHDYVMVTLGERPEGDYSLDRVDNDSGYHPGNLRWATREQQSNNRREYRNANPNSRHRKVSLGGIVQTNDS